MASSGTMISVFAQGLCLSRAHVAVRYRALREYGLVSKAGRGRSAAAMSPLDASRLLIALLAVQPIAQTAEATDLLGQADCVDSKGDAGLIDGFTDLKFDQALALILERSLAQRLDDATNSAFRFSELAIVVATTALTAMIELQGFSATYQPAATKSYSHDIDSVAQLSSRDRLMLRADRRGIDITARIEGPELLELAPALGPPGAVYRPTH